MAPVIQKIIRKPFPMAAQPGGSAFPDTTAVPLADGRADDCAEEVRQTGGTAGIYGMILCKTEKFPGCCYASADALFPVVRTVSAMILRQYMPWVPAFYFLKGCIRNGRHKLS